jgi:hypothetical protein
MVSWAVTGATRGIGVSTLFQLSLPITSQSQVLTMTARMDRQARKQALRRLATPGTGTDQS